VARPKLMETIEPNMWPQTVKFGTFIMAFFAGGMVHKRAKICHACLVLLYIAESLSLIASLDPECADCCHRDRLENRHEHTISTQHYKSLNAAVAPSLISCQHQIVRIRQTRWVSKERRIS